EWHRRTDKEVDRDHRDHSSAKCAAQCRWKLMAILIAEDKEHAEETEDRTRGSRRGSIRLLAQHRADVASGNAPDPAQEVDQEKARGSIEALDLRTDDPERVGVGSDM